MRPGSLRLGAFSSHVLFLQTAAFRRSLLRHILAILELAFAILNRLVQLVGVLGDHGRVGNVAFIAAAGRDEDVEPARNHEAGEEDDEDDVADCESHDVQRVGLAGQRVAGVDEVGVGEGVDDGKNGAGDVFDQRTPDDGDVPVLAGANDDVQILTELLALQKSLSDGDTIITRGWECLRSRMRGRTP